MNKKNQKGFSHILIVLLIALALGFFIYLKYDTSPENTAPPLNVQIPQEKISYRSDINNITFDYPSCLGEAIPDMYPSEFGERIAFSAPEGCIKTLSFDSISLGRMGIDRGAIIAGVDHTVLERELFTNNDGRNFAVVTYELPSYPDKYLVHAFYSKDNMPDETSEFTVMMGHNHNSTGEFYPLNQEELEQAKEFLISVMETVTIN